MKKIIMTGPTGAIGIALIQRLIKEEVEVTAVCHRGSKRIKNLPNSNKVKIVECNLDNLLSLKEELEQEYDVFYHLGWLCTGGDSRNNIETQIKNIRYTIDAVVLASALGCKRFVGAGSQAEYGRSNNALNADESTFPENGYGMAKLCAGQMSRIRCEQLGIEHIWVRILSVYGPYDGENTLIMSLIKKLLNGEETHCTKGEQLWDYCYSADAAQALRLLGEKGVPGKIYCIGSGIGRPLLEYMELIRDNIAPNAELGVGDIPYGEKQVMHLCADITDLKKDTGFKVEYSFEDGIKETVEWYKHVLGRDNE